MSVITLLSDFGITDEYVGVIKGVILSINPAVSLVDITHAVLPQDILLAADTIAAAYAYFPKGSIHIVVVDPGVGSDREIIGARLNGHVFLAPNNGVLSAVLEKNSFEEIVAITNERYFLNPISQTFHGRDIFAPVAAHLSLGVELTAVGEPIPDRMVVRLFSAAPKMDIQGRLEGRIVKVDRFGNLATNIQWHHIEPMLERDQKNRLIIEAGGRRLEGLTANYVQVPKGEPLAIMGSRQTLEVAVRDGHASDTLRLKKDDPVWVYLTLPKETDINAD